MKRPAKYLKRNVENYTTEREGKGGSSIMIWSESVPRISCLKREQNWFIGISALNVHNTSSLIARIWWDDRSDRISKLCLGQCSSTTCIKFIYSSLSLSASCVWRSLFLAIIIVGFSWLFRQLSGELLGPTYKSSLICIFSDLTGEERGFMDPRIEVLIIIHFVLGSSAASLLSLAYGAIRLLLRESCGFY